MNTAYLYTLVMLASTNKTVCGINVAGKLRPAGGFAFYGDKMIRTLSQQQLEALDRPLYAILSRTTASQLYLKLGVQTLGDLMQQSYGEVAACLDGIALADVLKSVDRWLGYIEPGSEFFVGNFG